MVANPNELGPRIEETQKKTPEKKQNPFSQEAITTQLAKEPESVKSMTAKHIKSPELKTYSEKKETELKVILEGKESIEKSPEKVKAEIVDNILKEKYGVLYEKAIKNGQKPEELREKYLASNEKILDTKLKDKDGKEIGKTKYVDILEKNKSFAKLNNKKNPDFTKELLTVYGIKEIEGYEGLIETAGKRGEKLPTTLEEFDKFIEKYLVDISNEKEIEEIKKHSKKGEIPENTKGYTKKKNLAMISSKLKMDGGINYSSYNGRTYESNMSIANNVDTGNIDNSYLNLQNVDNPENSKTLLIEKGLSENNARIISERVPKEWFNVAIDFANKEGEIQKDKPISLASVSKKSGIICYPSGKYEQFPIITAKEGRTDMIGIVSHFDGGKISGKGNDASKGGSKTVLGAAAYSPEGGANGGKWWHGVADYRIPNGKTWGCVGVKQEIAMRMVRSIQESGGGYGYVIN